MRFLLAVAMVLASAGSAGAQTVQKIKILDFGIYQRDIIERVPTTGVAAGALITATNFRLVKQTDTIPAKIGANFGIRFETIGNPKGKPVMITWVTRFPAQGLADPKNGRFDHNEFRRQHTIGEEGYRSYAFDEAWEMVPGERSDQARRAAFHRGETLIRPRYARHA